MTACQEISKISTDKVLQTIGEVISGFIQFSYHALTMKKKNARQTLLKKVESTRVFVKAKHNEVRGRLKTMKDISGSDHGGSNLEGGCHNTENTKARNLPSADYADQLQRTLEFLTEKERELDSIKTTLQAICQLPVCSADDKEKKDASGDVKGDAQGKAEVVKKLRAQLAVVHSEVTRCMAKDRRKLKLVKLISGAQDGQWAASVQNSQTSSESADRSVVMTPHSSESSSSTTSTIFSSLENFSRAASPMEMARELNSTHCENTTSGNLCEYTPLDLLTSAREPQEQVLTPASPSKTPEYTLRGKSNSQVATDEKTSAVNDSLPPATPLSITSVTPSPMSSLSRNTFHTFSSLLDFGQTPNDPEVTSLALAPEVEAASGFAPSAPTDVQPTAMTPLQTASVSKPLSPPPSPEETIPPWKVKVSLVDQALIKYPDGTAKDAGRTDLVSSDQTMRVILVKSSDIVGYSGPGIFDQTHSWTSVHLDRDMIMDRVFEHVFTYLGLVNRGLMRLWVFERTSDGHFLPRSILKGDAMRARLSKYGRDMVVLFVQFAEDTRRLYTFNHQHERLVFIKSRDVDSGQAVVYGHHVVNISMSTRAVVKVLQEKFLGSASSSVRYYVESSPGQTESVPLGSTSIFKMDLGRFCQHGVILVLVEDGSKAVPTSRMRAGDVKCHKALEVCSSAASEEIGAHNSSTSNGCHKVVTAYNFLNANEGCGKQHAAYSSFMGRDTCHDLIGASDSSVKSDVNRHHVKSYNRFVNTGEPFPFSDTVVDADTWSPGPSTAPFSHLDLTHLYFQRASLSCATFRQPQFIVPLNPNIIAMPVLGFEQGQVPQFGHVINPDPSTLEEGGLVYETVSGAQEHVTRGRVPGEVCDGHAGTAPTCCKAVSKRVDFDDRKVKGRSSQAENVLNATADKKTGDTVGRGAPSGCIPNVSGSRKLLGTPSRRHSKGSVKTVAGGVQSPASRTPDPALKSPIPSQNSTPRSASCTPLNVNALEFIPGSKLEARDTTQLDCSPSESNAGSSFSTLTCSNVQTPSTDSSSPRSKSRPMPDWATLPEKPAQDVATPLVQSAEQGEHAKETHEGWRVSSKAEVLRQSHAENIRSNSSLADESSSNCRRRSEAFRKEAERESKVQHVADESRSGMKGRSSSRVLRGRTSSLPPRHSGPGNHQRAACQSVFRPTQNRYSSWTESQPWRPDNFRPFLLNPNNRCFAPGALEMQSLKFGKHVSLPRSGCLPQYRHGWSNVTRSCGEEWNRSRQFWNGGNLPLQRKNTPRDRDARPSLQPVYTRKSAGAERKVTSEANSGCRNSGKDFHQVTQRKTGKVAVSDENRTETCVCAGDRSDKAALSAGHATRKVVPPATDTTRKPASSVRPAPRGPSDAFRGYNRIHQLPRFTSNVKHHGFSAAPSPRFRQRACAKNVFRQSSLGRTMARNYSQEICRRDQRPARTFPNTTRSKNSSASSPAVSRAALSRRPSAADVPENNPLRKSPSPAPQGDLPRVRKGFIRYVGPPFKNVSFSKPVISQPCLSRPE